VISRGQDQVGLAILDDRLRLLMRPGATASHVTRLQAEVEQLSVRPTLQLGGGLRELFERSLRRGVLLLMSDFLLDDLDQVYAALRLFRHRGWEVVVLHLVHPDEERLPPGAAYCFEGMEGEGRVDCSPAEVESLYRARFEAHAAMVRQITLAGGCDYRRVSLAIPYLETLGGFLVEGAG